MVWSILDTSLFLPISRLFVLRGLLSLSFSPPFLLFEGKMKDSHIIHTSFGWHAENINVILHSDNSVSEKKNPLLQIMEKSY